MKNRFNNDMANTSRAADPNRFQLLTLDDLFLMPTPTWLIQDQLPSKGLVFVYGAPNHGKSTLILSIACSISADRSLQVAYIPTEGLSGIKDRLTGWINFHNKTPNVRIMVPAPNLSRDTDLGLSLKCLKEIEPDIVILDTFSGLALGLDENSSRDMNTILDRIKKIQAELDCVIICIHHSGKDSGQGLRGSSALNAAADTVLRISKSNQTITLKCEKQRDGALAKPTYFELVTVAINHPSLPYRETVVADRSTHVVAKTHKEILLDLLETSTPVPKQTLKANFCQAIPHSKDPEAAFRTTLKRLEDEGSIIQKSDEISLLGSDRTEQTSPY